MKMKKFIKRITVLGMVAALIASGPVLNVRAAPNGNPGEKDSVEMPELIEIDQSYASGGITPTVFKDSYKNTRYRSRAALPAQYILSTHGKSTTVKNQNPWGSCWAFGALSSLESSQLTDNTNSAAEADPDYSERQLAWFAYEPQTADSIKVSAANSDQAGEGASYTTVDRLDRGGNMPQATALLSTCTETGNLDFKPFLPAKCRNTQEINDISTLFYTPFHPVLHYSLYQGYSPPLNPEGYRETNISKGSL